MSKAKINTYWFLLTFLIVGICVILLAYGDYESQSTYSIINAFLAISIGAWIWIQPLEEIITELMKIDEMQAKGGKIFKRVYLLIFVLLSTLSPYLWEDGDRKGVGISALVIFGIWHLEKIVQIAFNWIIEPEKIISKLFRLLKTIVVIGIGAYIIFYVFD